jgi:hypothetical protein
MTEARTHHPRVTDAISDRLQELLKGELSTQQLTPVQIANLAQQRHRV